MLAAWVFPLALVSMDDAEPPADRADSDAVHVVVVGSAGLRAEMGRVVEELFAGDDIELGLESLDSLDVEAILGPPMVGARSRARAWIKLEARRALVFVTDRDSERVLVRRLEFDRLDEVALEEIGYVVDSNIRAILDGGLVGIERDAARALVAPPAQEPADASPGQQAPPVETGADAPELDPSPTPEPGSVERGLGLSVWAGYGVRWFGANTVFHGPTLHAGAVRTLGRVAVGGSLRGRVYVPGQVARGNLGLAIWGGHAGGQVEAMFMVQPWLGIGLEPGVGVDLLRVRPVALDENADAFAATVSVLPVVTALAGPEFFSPGRNRVRVGLRAAVDIDLAPIRYVSADRGQTVFAPWQVRPGVVFTIGWDRRSWRR